MKLSAQEIKQLSLDQKRTILEKLLKKKAGLAKTFAPASYGQEALWVIAESYPDVATYTIPCAARITSPLDTSIFRQALNDLIARHASLRTTFDKSEDHPRQVIHNRQEVQLETHDATTWTDADLEREMRAVYETPFDLQKGPLFRVNVYTRDQSEHVLLITIHHSVCDGWSVWLLLEELGELYAARIEQRSPILKSLTVKYTAYVQRQRQLIDSEEGRRLEAYWHRRLSGELPTLDLPTDRPRPPMKTYQGDTCTFVLSAELTARVKAAAKAQRSTLFTYLMSVYQTLLHRYSQQNDILVGYPTTGRSEDDLAGLVGYFANIIVQRAQITEDDTFHSLLQRTRQDILEGMAHQDMPFPYLLDSIEVTRDLSRSPLIQTLFTLQRPHKFHAVAELMTGESDREPVQWGPLTVEPFAFHEQESRFDLNLEMIEAGTTLCGFFRYNTDLFDHATIQRMCGHFERLLMAVVDNPDQPLKTYPMLGAEEIKQQFTDWNQTQMDYDRAVTVHRQFADMVAARPDAIAIEFEGQTLSYQELNERTDRLAGHLQSMGVGPNRMVGVLVERSIDLVVALLAVLKSGGAYVPLDPLYPRERIEFILEDADAPVLITQEDLAGDFVTEASLVLMDQVDTMDPAIYKPITLNADDLAYVIFTSGSTGKPKGVQIPHGALMNFLQSMQREPGLTPDDTILAVTTVSFDISVLEIFLPLITGARVLMVSRETATDGPQLIKLLNRATFLQATPATWRLLLESGWQGHPHLTMLCGGEALHRSLSRQLIDKGRCLWNMYGPTETTIWSTIYQVLPDVGANREETGGCELIGRPIANTQCYVLDQQLNPVPVGVSGELHIGGDGLARGYLNRAELTAEKFISSPFGNEGDRLYKTGDLVRYKPNGQLEYLGRIDHQVKIRGYRIELGEVEAALSKHDDVNLCAVVVTGDESDRRLAAYYVTGNEQLKTSALRDYLKEHLPEYMVPSHFAAIDDMPLTPNGKVDRKRLPNVESVAVSVDENYVAARTGTEAKLVEIWTAILKMARVGIHDNFFDLGGHSLLATQMVSRVRQTFEVEIPLRQIFNTPTIAAIAAIIDAAAPDGSSGRAMDIHPVGREGRLPLSFAQQRLWFLDQMEGLNATYNLAFAVDINGRLETDLVRQAFNIILQRHEVLRTNYSSQEGQAHQTIRAEAFFEMPIIDLTHIPADQQQREAQRHIDAETQQPFALKDDLLVRLNLLKLSDNRHILLLTMHHIVSDGWSMGIFLSEFKALYTALQRDQSNPLADMPVQYIDFAHWQRQWLQGNVLTRQLDFWKQKLAGAPALLEMPTDRPRPAVENFDGDFINFRIDDDTYQALKACAARHGATLFMVLHAIFVMLLYRYSGKEDIVIGTPVANRHNSDVERMIGFFVNSLVLRSDVSGNPSFAELLRRVKEADLDAFDYPHVPFEQLIEKMGVKRSLSHAPWFQIFFALQNAPLDDLSTDDFTMSLMEQRNQTSMFDITVDMQEQKDGITGILQFKTDLYDRATAQRLVNYYRHLIDQVIADDECAVSEYQLMASPERQQVVEEWNQTSQKFAYDGCLHHWFEQRVRQQPDAVAVVYDNQSLTYEQLNARANQVADYLINKEIGSDQLVGISFQRGMDMIVAMLGVLKSGAGYVPIDPAYPAERQTFMQEDACLREILTESIFQNLNWDSLSTSNPTVEVSDKNLAYVIYTSGTTGKPKGVMIQHDSLVNYVAHAIEQFEMTPQDRLFQFSSISFDAAAEEIFCTLVAGATLVVRTEESIRTAATFVDESHRHGITIWDMPTAYWHQLSHEILSKDLPLPDGLRFILFGGEKVSAQAMKAWFERYPNGPRVLNTYGPTEATIVATSYFITPNDFCGEPQRDIPIGRPVSNLTAYILDAHHNPVPVGVPGELYIGGHGLARGYLNRAELTTEKFVRDPFVEDAQRMYRTGDLVRYRTDGQIEYLGRVDKQVKIRGYRIELGEIEAALAQHPAVSEVFVHVLERSEQVRVLVAYVVLSDDIPAADLREYMSERMPNYMVPSFIIPMAQLPLTVNGKVDAAALPDPAEGEDVQHENYVAPRNAEEQQLSELWSEVLGLNRIGIEDNFFELGGHSLLAAQLITRIYETFGADVPLRRLFETPTIAGLAATLSDADNATTTGTSFDVTPVPRDQHLPLSFAQQRLWFLDQLEGSNATYNMPVAIRIRGHMNPDLFEKVFGEIVRRHEVFRTRFLSEGGSPYQVTDIIEPFRLKQRDLSALGQDEQRHRVERLVAEDARRPFDLSTGPMVRGEIVKLDDEDHVLLFTMHHIISDGWSTEILIKEFSQLYDAFYHDQPSPLEELPVQYADFAYWQNQWLKGEMLESQLKYWEDRLRGAPQLLDMPTDRIRPPVETYRGSNISFQIPRAVADQLNVIARDNQSTLFMVLHTILVIMLNRFSRQEDIVLGSPLANRPNKNVEGLIGFFVNTMVLRADLSGNPTFKELLDRIRQSDLSDFEHPHVPFEHLIDVLKPERSLSHSPWFQVMFVLQNTPMAKSSRIANLELEPLDQDTGTAKFELTFGFVETDEGLTGSLEYNSDVYDEATVQAMSRYLEGLMRSVARDIHQPISSYRMIEHDEGVVQAMINPRAIDVDRTVQELFQEQARRTPAATAVESNDASLSYRQLDELSNALAQRLIDHGVQAQEMIGVCMERSVEMIVAVMGILKAGGAYVPIDPRHPAERLEYIRRDANLEIVLTQKHLHDIWSHAPKHLWDVDLAGLEPQSRNVEIQVAPEHLAYVIYTSGTSGQPKGVLIEHRALSNFVIGAAQDYEITAEDRVLQFASLSFDAAAEEIYPCLTRGGTLVLRNDQMISSAAEFIQTCTDQRITVLDLPTAYWHQLVSSETAIQSVWPESVRLVIIGGERAKPEMVQSWMRMFGTRPKLINTYGPTETTVVATAHVVTENDTKVLREVPIGRPVANTTAYVLDEQLRPVAPGVPGELCIGGTGLARGYLNQPGLTRQRFIEHPFESGQRMYRTGDLVRQRMDGVLEFRGRIDRQVKIRGFRIELGEIESVLAEHGRIRECVVQTVASSTHDVSLAAYVVSDDEWDAKTLQEYLKARLPGYMVPAYFIAIPSVPLNTSGKVDYRQLPQPDRDQDAVKKEYTAPRTRIEQQLARIWSDVLGVEQVGIHDDFFDLGGHSLMATQLIARVRDELELEISLRHLFEASTIAQIAERMTVNVTEFKQIKLPPIKPVPRRKYLPVPNVQKLLWDAYQKDKKSFTYNICGAIRLNYDLDHDLLTTAVNKVIERHESLRTTFHRRGEKVVQQIHAQLPIEIPVMDLSGLNAADQERQVQAMTATHAHHAFNLCRGPLIKVDVLILGPQQFVLLVNLHHIITDGWSMDVLINEIMTFYQSIPQGVVDPLPPLDVQYYDYVQWCEDVEAGEIGQREFDYWERKLDGVPELLNLPLDYPRPPKQGHEGDIRYLNLGADLTRRVQEFCQNTSKPVTVFTFMQSVFAMLLHKYAQQEDIIVGTTLAGRHTPEMEKIIGVCVQTAVIRNEFQGDPTFMQLLDRNIQTIAEMFDHIIMPFSKVKEALGIEKPEDRTAVFQVKFILQNFGGAVSHDTGLEIEMINQEIKNAKNDLMLVFNEQNGSLVGEMSYRVELFKSETVERLLIEYREMLEAVLADPSRHVSEYQQRALVPIQRDGFGTPVFCVHPIGGNVMCYASLAKALGKNISLYAMQSRGLSGGEQALSLRQMAREYIAEIRMVQPQGPYRLSGWSMGGVIAFEMARQLEADGERIEFLGMIDSYVPRRDDADDAQLLEIFAQDLSGITGKPLSCSASELRRMDDADQQLEAFIHQARTAGVLSESLDAAYIKRVFQVFKANYHANQAYTPEVYTGDVTLFSAKKASSFSLSDPRRGWTRWVKGRLDVISMDADHYTIVQTPHIKAIADHMRSRFEILSQPRKEAGDAVV